MAGTRSGKSRKVRPGSPDGIPRRALDVKSERKQPDVDGYDWGVDVAGEITLGGMKLVLANRAGVKIRSPLRLT